MYGQQEVEWKKDKKKGGGLRENKSGGTATSGVSAESRKGNDKVRKLEMTTGQYGSGWVHGTQQSIVDGW
jgi:hypothetical protein